MMTLSKLSKLANVSVSTASKAFSGSTEVNKETREMIFDIARKNGCFKKFYNVKYPKLVVAIIAPEFDSAYYTRYLSYIQKYLHQNNCELCVSTTDFSQEREKDLLEYYCKHANVDGVIAINIKGTVAENYETPIVFVNPANEILHYVSIFSDYKSALEESIRYLANKGVTIVGFIGETLTAKKLDSFKLVLNEQGLLCDENYISLSEKRFEEGGYDAMEKLFSQNKVPRAIVCAYDYMAIGAIRCIYDHGLSVLGDVAVLGFDDIPQAAFLNPPLASISTPVEELCQIATESVMCQIKGAEISKHQRIDGKFHLRKSFEIQ